MQVRTKAIESMQLCDNTRLGDYIDGESIRNTTSIVNNQYRCGVCCLFVSACCVKCVVSSVVSWALPGCFTRELLHAVPGTREHVRLITDG